MGEDGESGVLWDACRSRDWAPVVGAMSEQACRFSGGVCTMHSWPGKERQHASLCNLGLAALRATVEEQAQEIARLTHLHKLDHGLADQRQIALDEQARVIGGLRGALKRYGKHDHTCWQGTVFQNDGPCICGLEQALSTEPKEAPYWRCVRCDQISLGHEITPATATCGCGTGMGRWEVYCHVV